MKEQRVLWLKTSEKKKIKEKTWQEGSLGGSVP